MIAFEALQSHSFSNPGVTFQKNIIQDHFAETIEWDSQDEMLYNYFKYDLRSPLDAVMKEYNITGWKIYEFLERLPENS